MKMMKIALIGSAALAAATLSARADELSDLKAQIEALNGRMATLETQPAVPAGYQLLSISQGAPIAVPGLDADKYAGDTATVISVLPTADAPAATEVTVSGYARAGLVYSKVKGAKANEDILARGQLNVSGKTDTAVGEVGAKLGLRGNYHSHGDASVTMNEAWGWWAMTPELTLGGGYTGSLSGIGYGYDGACNCYYTDSAAAGYGHGDTTQMRLSYSSGPMGFAVALEDESNGSGSKFGAAAEVKYSGDMFSGEISGGAWGHGDAWAGVGSSVKFDMFNLSWSAGAGKAKHVSFWKANILASANLSDAVHAEIGFNHFDGKGSADQDAVLAGVYYDPVDKLTIGLEGEMIDNKGAPDATTLDLVTVYRF